MKENVFFNKRCRLFATGLALLGTFAVIARFAWTKHGAMPPEVVIASCLLASLLVYGAVVDIYFLFIPDTVSLGLFPLGLIVTAVINPDAVPSHLVTGIVVAVIFLLAGRYYQHCRGRSGFGMGDTKLLASAGTWIGPLAFPSVVLIGCLLGIASVFIRRFVRSRRAFQRPLAFGPHISLGFWVVWNFGPIKWLN